MRTKIPDKYKYLFETYKPLDKCSLEEKAVYAYFDHKAKQYDGWLHVTVLNIVALLISIIAIVIRIVK